MRMDIGQRPIIFQISMPCSAVATALKLASPMEIDENKRSFVARCRGQLQEGWRAMDFGIQSAFWQLVGRLGLAVLVGSALGINRNLHRKPAGIRTHALVSLSTALVTLIAFESTGHGAGRLLTWSTLAIL